jgi:choice-of-anchor B domain-containing protein
MKKLFQFFLWSTLILGSAAATAQNFNLELRSTLTFPNQTLANIAGYTQDGREYALVGGSKGLIIVDITDPASPVQIVQIPGPDNLWKEIKTFSHYAYVTSEGGGGVQIVDLSTLPSASLLYHNYTGDGEIAGQLDDIHALHIDVSKGFLYAFGGGLFGGGAKVLDLNADPYNPTYVGKFDQLGYIHDGYADNDTLYAGHIYEGLLSIVDMSDKQDPKLLGTVETPGNFTHNAWLLDDHKHILTTDEATPSFLTSFDISDPTDIKELDRYSPDNGSGSLGHNTHVRNDWAVTSWYSEGVIIVDAHRPENLVRVAQYDTWAGSGANFDGNWGAYPFFPSGTIVATNINPAQLFVLTPTYVRASYLEGTITNACTGLPVTGAQIVLNGGTEQPEAFSDNNGAFKTGLAQSGAFTATILAPGFVPQTVSVTLNASEVTALNVELELESAFNVDGLVLDAASGQPLANTPVVVVGPTQTVNLTTDAAGGFDLTCAPGGNYAVYAGGWGYLPGQAVVNSDGAVTVALQRGYYDDFSLDFDWTTTSNASTGQWVRGEPVGTEYDDNISNPEVDAAIDAGDQAFVTGNGGGGAGNDDVDDGEVVLTSPVLELAAFQDAILSFQYWFFNDGGQGQPNDGFEVRVTNGIQTVTVLTEAESQSGWRSSGDIHLADFITLNDNVQVQFIATDEDPGHIVEAGVDVFQVEGIGLVGIQGPDAAARLDAAPNPSAGSFTLSFEWEQADGLSLEVRNVLGQVVLLRELGAASGSVQIGQDWAPGAYFATLRQAERRSLPVKLVKQ